MNQLELKGLAKYEKPVSQVLTNNPEPLENFSKTPSSQELCEKINKILKDMDRWDRIINVRLEEQLNV